MNKRCALIVAIAATIALLYPVSSAAQAWYLDFYGGWCYSNLSGSQSSLTDGGYKSGFAGGVSGELMLNEDWGWEIGLWYTMKGSKGNFQNTESNIGFLPGSDDSFDGSISLDYIQIPILVNVYFPVAETSRIRGFIGPTFAFLTRAEADGTYQVGTSEPTSGTRDIKDSFDDADITVMIGAGGQFKLDRVTLMLDFRWDIGATDIAKQESATVRTNSIMITVGVGIPLVRYDE